MKQRQLLQYAELHDRNTLKAAAADVRDWAIKQVGTRQTLARRAIKAKSNQLQSYTDESGIVVETLHTEIPGANTWFYRVTNQPETHQVPTMCAIIMLREVAKTTAEISPDSGGVLTSLIDLHPDYDGPEADQIDSEIIEIIQRHAPQQRIILPQDSNGANPMRLQDLMTDRNTVIVIPCQDNGQPEPSALQIAENYTRYANVVILDHQSHRAIARDIDQPDQLFTWVKSDMALVHRMMPHPDNYIITDLPLDDAQVSQILSRHVRFLHQNLSFHIGQYTMSSMMADAAILHTAMSTLAKGEPLTETNDQRRYVLEDQLKQANLAIANREQTINNLTHQLDAFNGDQNDSTELTLKSPDEVETPDKIINAIAANEHRWQNLVFMDSMLDAATHFSMPRPDPPEFIKVMDSLQSLAQALANTPSHKIGQWEKFFQPNPSWSFRPKESDQTMARYGSQRQFNHQGTTHTVTMHLTLKSRRGSAQIYFQVNPDNPTEIMVAHIGPHLPYISQK